MDPKRRLIPRRVGAAIARERADASDACIAEAFGDLLSGLLEGTLPAEMADRLVSVRRGKAAFNFQMLTEFLWQLHGKDVPYSADALRERLRDIARDFRRRCRQEAEQDDQHMSTFLEKIPALFERLHRLATPKAGSDPGEPAALPDRIAPEVCAEILNVVRGAAGRVMPREYGEGIRDADVDRVEGLLLELGKDLQRRWGEDATSREVVAADLSKFLAGLQNYDPASPASDFDLLNSGARLLIELTGPKSFFGLFAQLNIYAVIDRLLPPADFIDAMRRLADDAEELAETRAARDLVARLNQAASAEDDKLPTARRLTSYCLANLVFAALNAALAEEAPEAARKEWASKAQSAADHIALKDSGFELIKPARLALAAVAAERDGDGAPFIDVVRRLGIKESVVFAEKIRRHFKRDALIEAVDRCLRRFVPPEREAPTAALEK